MQKEDFFKKINEGLLYSPFPVGFGEEEELASGLQGSAFFSSPFLKLFWPDLNGLWVDKRRKLLLIIHRSILKGCHKSFKLWLENKWGGGTQTYLRLTVPLGTGGNWKTWSGALCWLAFETQWGRTTTLKHPCWTICKCFSFIIITDKI